MVKGVGLAESLLELVDRFGHDGGLDPVQMAVDSKGVVFLEAVENTGDAAARGDAGDEETVDGGRWDFYHAVAAGAIGIPGHTGIELLEERTRRNFGAFIDVLSGGIEEVANGHLRETCF